jgi:hypothetical protein
VPSIREQLTSAKSTNTKGFRQSGMHCIEAQVKSVAASLSMKSSSQAEQIKQLCGEAVAAQDPRQLAQVARDLRAALHEQLQFLKERTTEQASTFDDPPIEK